MSVGVYLIIFAAVILISLLFVIAMIQNSVDEEKLIATPSIRHEDAVLTAFASIKIKGTPDEVFDVIKKYKGYSDWSPFHDYKWNDVTMDGVPRVGSTGVFTFTIEDFVERVIPVKLSLLDRESRMLAEVSTDYPRCILCSERVQEVVPIEGQPGFCEYRTYQTIGGLGAYYHLLTHQGDFDDCQRKCATELKSFIELGPRQETRPEEIQEPTILASLSHIVSKKFR